jgi:phosphatidylserine/phosphatidylglycerophosphate/cardiolipin synthase-like enzyme
MGRSHAVPFNRGLRSVTQAVWVSVLFGIAVFLATPQVASAQGAPAASSCVATGECLCDSSYQDCRAPLINLIRNEDQGIDVSMWFMTDPRYKDEIISRWKAGVPVRIIVDTQADGNYPANKTIRDAFRTAGIPIRDCTSSKGINHWKAMIFEEQGKVQFSAANFSNGSFSPYDGSSTTTTRPYIDYVDEAIYFTDDPDIYGSFVKYFDDHWTNTTDFVNWANISGTPTRKFPVGTYTVHSSMNFVPYQNYETRLAAEVLKETQQIDAVMFRITSAKIPDALINRHQAGVPVRLITDPGQYRNPSYFWDSYNVDRMYVAGIPIKWKNKDLSDQDMHQKSIVLYNRGGTSPGPMVVFGSSNWTSSSASGQREHNYFSRKSWMLDWFIEQFERKWNNLRIDGTPIGMTAFEPFEPGFPETPVIAAPANDALGQATTVTLKWEGGWWAHKYDIAVSTSPTPMSDPAPVFSMLDYAPGSATAGVGSTKESVIVSNLQPGTVYYWQVRGKTMANKTKLGPVWRFTTAGGVPAPPAPSGLTATPVTAARVDLAWTDVAGEEGYKVERKLSTSTTWTQIATRAGDVTTYVDASGLSPGTTYNYRVRAYTSGGNSGYSNTATATTPTPTLSAGDIVLHPGKALIKFGWSSVSDGTAAGGSYISNSNAGAATVTTASADPAKYFEMSFTAEANTGYRLWMRGKAANNNGYNDSVWVQFDDSVSTPGGAAVYRIGTTSATWVNLQDCSGATISGWGWQDNGYAASPCGYLGPLIYFATSGTHTIRVQVREDGAAYDQIVLSPDTYLNASPGATKSDTVKLPAQGGL